MTKVTPKYTSSVHRPRAAMAESHACHIVIAINKQKNLTFLHLIISVYKPAFAFLISFQYCTYNYYIRKVALTEITVNVKLGCSCFTVLNIHIHIAQKLTEAIYSKWTLRTQDKQVLWVTKLYP